MCVCVCVCVCVCGICIAFFIDGEQLCAIYVVHLNGIVSVVCMNCAQCRF